MHKTVHVTVLLTALAFTPASITRAETPPPEASGAPVAQSGGDKTKSEASDRPKSAAAQATGATARAEAGPAQPSKPPPPSKAEQSKLCAHAQPPAAAAAPARDDSAQLDRELKLLEDIANNIRALTWLQPMAADDADASSTLTKSIGQLYLVASLLVSFLFGPLLCMFMTRRVLRQAGLM